MKNNLVKNSKEFEKELGIGCLPQKYILRSTNKMPRKTRRWDRAKELEFYGGIKISIAECLPENWRLKLKNIDQQAAILLNGTNRQTIHQSNHSQFAKNIKLICIT